MARQRRHKKPPSLKISSHFSKRDFYCKESRDSFKISLGLIGALEFLRAKVNKRITIVKGYESPESAEKSGKLSRNLHVTGVAADIAIEGMDIRELFIHAEEIDEFKGIGLNLEENYIHVDTRKTDERKLWIEEGKRMIDLDESNRQKYFAD